MRPTRLSLLRLLAVAVALLSMPLAAGEPETGRLAPASLRCEYAVDPLGIDVAKPRLFWQVESPDRGERQTAWHVLVASSAEILAADRGDLWDSGRIDSDETAHIRYAGDQDLAGITVDEAGPGFKAFVLRPQPVDGLAWAEARYDSLRGRISSRWERRGDRLTLTVSIPANTSAEVYVPSRDGSDVAEGGIAAASRPGVTFIRRDSGAAVYRIQSGRYVFDSRW